MASQVDPTYPVQGTPTTQSVRDNFQFTHDEIEALQTIKLDTTGGIMTGPILLDPAQIVDGGTFP